MKLALNILLIACFALVALATAPHIAQKPVIISYPSDTPTSVLEEAKDAIKKAVRTPPFSCDFSTSLARLTHSQGGIITHEYHLIKAFAAKAPTKILDTVQAMGSSHEVLIEEDQVVSIS